MDWSRAKREGRCIDMVKAILERKECLGSSSREGEARTGRQYVGGDRALEVSCRALLSYYHLQISPFLGNLKIMPQHPWDHGSKSHTFHITLNGNEAFLVLSKLKIFA